MFSVYKEVFKSSLVNYSCFGQIYGPEQSNLIISTTDALKIYEIKNNNKLLFKEKILCEERILDVRIMKDDLNFNDYIIVLFPNSRISVLQYDENLFQIRTVSIHNYESYNFKTESCKHICSSLVASTSDNIAFIFYDSLLVSLSLSFDRFKNKFEAPMQKKVVQQINNEMPTQCFHSTLKEILPNLQNIRSIEFINSKYQNFLAILYEPLQACSWYINHFKDTCRIVLVSFVDRNINSNKPLVIMKIDHLPFDSYKIVPLPSHLGGLFVLHINGLVYIDNSGEIFSIAINNDIHHMDLKINQQYNFDCQLKSSNCVFFQKDSNNFILTNEDGLIFHGNLYKKHNDDLSYVVHLKVIKSLPKIYASTISSLNNSILFIGSRLHFSKLVKILLTNNVYNDYEVSHPYKRVKEESTVFEDNFLISFEELDCIKSVSTISSCFLSNPVYTSEEFSQSGFTNLELTLCTGKEPYGFIDIFQQGIIPSIITSFEIPNCHDFWTIKDMKKLQSNANDDYHKYLVIRLENRTMVLALEDDIIELEHGFFILDEPTVFVSNTCYDQIIQITTKQIRLVSIDDDIIYEHKINDDGNIIVTASINNLYGFFLLSNGELHLMHLEDKSISISKFDSEIYVTACLMRSNLSSNSRMELCLVCVNSSFVLSIYQIHPRIQLFKDIHFGLLSDILFTSVENNNREMETKYCLIEEIECVELGDINYLFCKTSYEVFVYELYEKSSKLILKKIKLDCLIMNKSTNNTITSHRFPLCIQTKSFKKFSNINGYEGVFVCGQKPTFIINDIKGLICQPLLIDGMIINFASLHNVNCKHGFIFMNRRNDLRMCQLNMETLIDFSGWSWNRINTSKFTPIKVCYLPSSKVYCVSLVNSNNSLINKQTSHSLCLIDQHNRKIDFSNNFHFPFSENEVLTSLKTLKLSTTNDSSLILNFICASTCIIPTELEAPVSGKVIIFNTDTETISNNISRSILKVFFKKEFSTIVSTIGSCKGNLLIATNRKVGIYRYNSSVRDIVCLSSVDIPSLTVDIKSIKSMIFCGDFAFGTKLLHFQHDYNYLSLVSKEDKSSQICSIDFAICGNRLGLLSNDKQGNLTISSYKPDVYESKNGQLLVIESAIRTGKKSIDIFKLNMDRYDLVDGIRFSTTIKESKFVSFIVNDDGTIGCLLPINERVYRRLLSLEQRIDDHLIHPAGINPKSFRQYICDQIGLNSTIKPIINGDLFMRYNQSSYLIKNELSKRIGTNLKQIHDDLFDCERFYCIF